MGYLQTAAGQIISATHANLALAQGVLRFANAAERTTQVTAPAEGMVSYLLDVDRLESYDGAAWVPFNARKGGYFSQLVNTSGGSVGAAAYTKPVFSGFQAVSQAPGYQAIPGSGSAGSYTGFVVPVAGLWYIAAWAAFASSATASYGLDFTLNSSTRTDRGIRSSGNTPGGAMNMRHSTFYPFAAGAVVGVELSAWGAASTWSGAALQMAGPF
jgi:hypothetical protein